jgi:hypothetical protein
VVTTYRYDAFGAVRSQSSPHDNDWLLAGEVRDSESGYDYLRARYYRLTATFIGKNSRCWSSASVDMHANVVARTIANILTALGGSYSLCACEAL